jgi:hypothetical protein
MLPTGSLLKSLFCLLGVKDRKSGLEYVFSSTNINFKLQENITIIAVLFQCLFLWCCINFLQVPSNLDCSWQHIGFWFDQ